MSPEEFDNRLRSSFKDEFVPPKEHLWRNIDTRLDQQTKKPVWYWLVPLAIVAVASIAWLTNTYTIGDKTDAPNTNTIAASNNSTSAQSADASANNQTRTALSENNNNSTANTVAESSDLPAITIQTYESNNTPSGNTNGNAVTGKARSGKSKSAKNPKTLDSENPTAKSGSNNGSDINNTSTLISNSDNSANKNNTRSESEFNNQSVFSKLFFVKRFKRNLSVDWLSKAERSPITWPVLKTPLKKGQTAEDMAWGGNFEDNKWWLNFGVGYQIAYNNFHSTYDSATKNKIHRTLIDNEDQLTNNGAGFQMHLNLQKKFGKSNRFSFETGVNYSYRTEDIKINEQTYDIAARNNNDDILNYLRLKLFIAVGTDTTFFDATQSFALVRKNKYSIITVPLRFQYEQPLNRNTFVSLGLGGGASIIRNNATTHYDMVKEKDFQKSSSTQFTASLNTMLSLYTNYNGIGQFGIYGGYQMYLSPFKVNEQYGVRMSDLQFGVILRRPLDLK